MTENELNPQPLAELEVGPSAFEQFLDRNQKNLIIAACVLVALAAGTIIYRGLVKANQDAAAAALMASYDKVKYEYDPVKLQAVTENFEGTPAAETATYLKALTLWRTGQTEEGVKALEAYAQDYPEGRLYPNAKLVLAGCYIQLGQVDQAKSALTEVKELEDGTFSPVALMTLGDLAKNAGDLAQAKSLYDEAREKYPDSSFCFTAIQNGTDIGAQESPIESRLELLEVKSPKMVLPEFDSKLPKNDESELKLQSDKSPLSL